MVGLSEMVPMPEWADPSYVTPRARMRQVVQDGGVHQQVTADTFAAKPPYLPLAMRSDVLVFQTDVLERDVELTGSSEVNLWISSSAVDTDFTANLIDVYPPSEDYLGGYHLNLCDSIIRARFRNGFGRAEMMEPGEAYRRGSDCPRLAISSKRGTASASTSRAVTFQGSTLIQTLARQSGSTPIRSEHGILFT